MRALKPSGLQNALKQARADPTLNGKVLCCIASRGSCFNRPWKKLKANVELQRLIASGKKNRNKKNKNDEEWQKQNNNKNKTTYSK